MKDIKKEIAEAVFRQIRPDRPGAGGIVETPPPDRTALERLIEIPPDPGLGDYSFPCFQLSKALRRSPALIAADLKTGLEKPDGIEKIENVGGYVNFFVDRAAFAAAALKEIEARGADYGRSEAGTGRTVVIDYCAANIAKPFHMGHLPTTVIGNSLYRLFRFLGYECIGVNHLGDWGTQFGKLITAYKKWGSTEQVAQDPIKELVKLYVRFHSEAEADESLNDEARAAFKAIEDGEAEYVGLWKWFRELSIAEFKRVLGILHIDFDSWDGESFYNDKMEAAVNELKEKGLLRESQGARVVDLSAYGMPPCIILRSDGATLYATRDLAAVLYRRKAYNFHKILYCVATQQNLHFQQVFKVVELMGYEWAGDLVHVANGMISLESGSMSTRKGTVVYLDDILREAVSKAGRIIEERNPGLEGREEIARMIGIGAVKFSALKNRRTKDFVFSWDKVLNFEGETSCYIQYTHARICSVLRKAGNSRALEADYRLLTDDGSYEVLKQLSQFPRTLEAAANEYEPSIISKYLIDLVQSFNRFYHDSPILSCGEEPRGARLELCKAVKSVVAAGMALLGIECPERM